MNIGWTRIHIIRKIQVWGYHPRVNNFIIVKTQTTSYLAYFQDIIECDVVLCNNNRLQLRDKIEEWMSFLLVNSNVHWIHRKLRHTFWWSKPAMLSFDCFVWTIKKESEMIWCVRKWWNEVRVHGKAQKIARSSIIWYWQKILSTLSSTDNNNATPLVQRELHHLFTQLC